MGVCVYACIQVCSLVGSLLSPQYSARAAECESDICAFLWQGMRPAPCSPKFMQWAHWWQRGRPGRAKGAISKNRKGDLRGKGEASARLVLFWTWQPTRLSGKKGPEETNWLIKKSQSCSASSLAPFCKMLSTSGSRKEKKNSTHFKEQKQSWPFLFLSSFGSISECITRVKKEFLPPKKIMASPG